MAERKPRAPRKPRKPSNRGPIRARRAVNDLLFENGMRHSAIKRLMADEHFEELADKILELNPTQQRDAIACIPIASKVHRLAEAGALYASLQQVAAQRRGAALRARELGQPVPAGADTGLVHLSGNDAGKIDRDLVRECTLLLRFAAEEVGEVQVSQQTTVNVFSAAQLGATVAVLCGNLPGAGGSGQ